MSCPFCSDTALVVTILWLIAIQKGESLKLLLSRRCRANSEEASI